MPDQPSTTREAEIERVAEVANRVAERTGQRFVFDPAKVARFRVEDVNDAA